MVALHLQMSDRAIGELAALRRSTDAVPQLNVRIGRDARGLDPAAACPPGCGDLCGDSGVLIGDLVVCHSAR